MTKRIPLTQNQFAFVDDEDFEYLSQWKWHAQWCEHTKSFYAIRNEGRNPQKKIRMHRVVAKTPDGLECDHDDHDTLNNQKYNLKNVTHSQNMHNRKINLNNKLGKMCIREYGSGYVVRVKKDKKFILYKCYKSLDDAIIARDRAFAERKGII